MSDVEILMKPQVQKSHSILALLQEIWGSDESYLLHKGLRWFTFTFPNY
jgi:hypothetical protein